MIFTQDTVAQARNIFIKYGTPKCEIRFLDGYALHYRYKLDEDMLNSAAQAYVGTHDFTSFCTLDSREKGDMTRTVKAFRLQERVIL